MARKLSEKQKANIAKQKKYFIIPKREKDEVKLAARQWNLEHIDEYNFRKRNGWRR